MHLTKKQIAVMRTIVNGYLDEEGDHQWLDLDQLLNRLPYETSKQSMQFTLRTLTKKYGLVTRQLETRRGRRRRIVMPTPAALRIFKPVVLRRDEDSDDGVIEFG